MHITRSATFTFVCRRLTKQKSTQNVYTLTETETETESSKVMRGRKDVKLWIVCSPKREEDEKRARRQKKHHQHQSLKLSTMPSLQTPYWVQNPNTQQAMKLQKRKRPTKGAAADERRRERQRRRRRRRRATATSSFTNWSCCCEEEEEEEDQPSPHGILPPLSGDNKQEAPVTGATSNRNHQLHLLPEPVTVQPYQPRAAWKKKFWGLP